LQVLRAIDFTFLRAGTHSEYYQRTVFLSLAERKLSFKVIALARSANRKTLILGVQNCLTTSPPKKPPRS